MVLFLLLQKVMVLFFELIFFNLKIVSIVLFSFLVIQIFISSVRLLKQLKEFKISIIIIIIVILFVSFGPAQYTNDNTLIFLYLRIQFLISFMLITYLLVVYLITVFSIFLRLILAPHKIKTLSLEFVNLNIELVNLFKKINKSDIVKKFFIIFSVVLLFSLFLFTIYFRIFFGLHFNFNLPIDIFYTRLHKSNSNFEIFILRRMINLKCVDCICQSYTNIFLNFCMKFLNLPYLFKTEITKSWDLQYRYKLIYNTISYNIEHPFLIHAKKQLAKDLGNITITEIIPDKEELESLKEANINFYDLMPKTKILDNINIHTFNPDTVLFDDVLVDIPECISDNECLILLLKKAIKKYGLNEVHIFLASYKSDLMSSLVIDPENLSPSARFSFAYDYKTYKYLVSLHNSYRVHKTNERLFNSLYVFNPEGGNYFNLTEELNLTPYEFYIYKLNHLLYDLEKSYN